MQTELGVHGAVVAGVDGSASSRRAAAYAAAEAQARRAPLHLLSVFPSADTALSADPYLPAPEALRPGQDKVLAGVGTELAASGVEVRLHEVHGDPASVLADATAQAVLTVVGAHEREGLAGLLTGSVGRRLLRHARGPVVVVRGEGAWGDGRPVLAGVDLDDPEPAVLDFAFAAAALRGVPLVACSVWSGDDDSVAATGGFAAAERRAGEVLTGLLADWRAKHPEVVLRQELTHDLDPAAALTAVSAEAGLIVVGATERPLAELFFGSVPKSLATKADCPVAVVPTRAGA